MGCRMPSVCASMPCTGGVRHSVTTSAAIANAPMAAERVRGTGARRARMRAARARRVRAAPGAQRRPAVVACALRREQAHRTQPNKYNNHGCSTRSQFCGELRIVQNTEGSQTSARAQDVAAEGCGKVSRESSHASPGRHACARAPDDRLTALAPNRPRRQLGIAPATVSGEAAPHARSRRGAGERWPSRRDPSPPGWAPRCWRAALPPRCSRVTPAVPVQAAAPPAARLTLGAKIRHTSRNRGGSTLGAPPWPWLREARAEERPRVRRHPPAIPTSDSGRDKSENTRAQSRLLGQGLARDVCAEAMGMG